MDNASKERLDAILKKEPAALTEADKQFLRSRESYLTADQKATYEDVFETPKKDGDPSEEAETPRKKSK